VFDFFVYLRLIKIIAGMNSLNITQYLQYLDIKHMDMTINIKQHNIIC